MMRRRAGCGRIHGVAQQPLSPPADETSAAPPGAKVVLLTLILVAVGYSLGLAASVLYSARSATATGAS
jgi:hypothetical protein